MASRIHRRKQAKADVDSISAYVAADNGKAAEDLLDRFGTVFEMLIQNPRAGRRRPDLGQNVRSLAVDNYVIFYIPQSAGIDIIRVMHGRRGIGPADLA
jgi:toxin ParE1/3/4